MKKILYVTGNSRKLAYARSVAEPFDVAIEQVQIELPEIQSHKPEEICIAKAQNAYAELRKPLVVCDYFWSITALRGFPGGYMKDIIEWFDPEDFLALMKGKKDRSVMLTDSVVYIDDVGFTVFQKQFPGIVTHEARGTGDVSCDPIIKFDGNNYTIAENIDRGKSSRDLTKSAWHEFVQWYAQ